MKELRSHSMIGKKEKHITSIPYTTAETKLGKAFYATVPNEK